MAATTPSRERRATAMRAQPYYEDVAVGMELPTLVKETSYMQLVVYAGASRDFYVIHHDRDHAKSVGLPDVIIQGSLKAAFLGQLVTRWMGEWATLRELAVQYRGIDVPGRPLTMKGRVTGKRADGPDHLVECEIWIENADGARTTRGTAVVALPSREQP